MASVTLRAMPSGTPGSAEYNGLQAVFSGEKGGRVRLIGYDGANLAPVGGASLGTGEFSLVVQSAATGGPHIAALHSGTASGATVAPTAANAVLLVRDDYIAVGMGKQLRLYDAVGTDYAQLTSSADGGLVLGGSGAGAGGMTMTYLALGATPSLTRALRLTNADAIAWRNAANSADVVAILVFTDDNLYLGNTTTPSVIVRAGTDVRLRATSDHVIAATSKLTLGVAADTLAFFGAAGAVKPAALTQTYATAERTLAAYTPDIENAAYVGLATGAGGFPYANVTDLNALRVAYENLRTFCEDLAQFHNSHVDDHQSMGLV